MRRLNLAEVERIFKMEEGKRAVQLTGFFQIFRRFYYHHYQYYILQSK